VDNERKAVREADGRLGRERCDGEGGMERRAEGGRQREIEKWGSG